MPNKLTQALTADDIAALPAFINSLHESLSPVSDDVLVVELERLFLHFAARAGIEGEAESRWDDWMEDFADVPQDCLRAAIKAWRNSKEKWAPTPGQLKAIIDIDGIISFRTLILKRAQELKELLSDG